MKEMFNNFVQDAKKVLKGMLIFFVVFAVIIIVIALMTSSKSDDNKGMIKETKVEMKVSKEQALINQAKAREQQEINRKNQEELMKQKQVQAEEQQKQHDLEIHNLTLQQADKNINNANDFINTTTKLIQTHYANKSLLTSIEAHSFIMSEIIKENAPQKEEAKNTQYSLDVLSRKVIASNLEEIFLKNNQGFEVKTLGKDSKTLQIKYALMTNQTAYNLINRDSVGDIAKKYSFSKVIMTDGYNSDFIYDFK